MLQILEPALELLSSELVSGKSPERADVVEPASEDLLVLLSSTQGVGAAFFRSGVRKLVGVCRRSRHRSYYARQMRSYRFWQAAVTVVIVIGGGHLYNRISMKRECSGIVPTKTNFLQIKYCTYRTGEWSQSSSPI